MSGAFLYLLVTRRNLSPKISEIRKHDVAVVAGRGRDYDQSTGFDDDFVPEEKIAILAVDGCYYVDGKKTILLSSVNDYMRARAIAKLNEEDQKVLGL